VAGGHPVHAGTEDCLLKHPELDAVVADHAGVRGPSAKIFAGKRGEHFFFEGIAEIDDAQSDTQPIGNRAYPFFLGGAALMRQAHEKPLDPVVGGKDQRAGGGINAAAHRYADGILCHSRCCNRELRAL
jgi:hypothetical protein